MKLARFVSSDKATLCGRYALSNSASARYKLAESDKCLLRAEGAGGAQLFSGVCVPHCP